MTKKLSFIVLAVVCLYFHNYASEEPDDSIITVEYTHSRDECETTVTIPVSTDAQNHLVDFNFDFGSFMAFDYLIKNENESKRNSNHRKNSNKKYRKKK